MSNPKPWHERPLKIYGADSADAGAEGDPIAFNDQEGRTDVTTTSGFGGGGVHYIPLPIGEGAVHSVQLRYHDGTVATSAAELQVCNVPRRLIDNTDEGADDWATESGVTVPTHSAGIGSDMIDIASIAARRARLKLTISANGEISAWAWSK